MLCAQFGVPFESVKLVQGDSDIVHTGNGTGGSRSITASGMAIVRRPQLVIEKGKRAAAHMLEASEADIEFADGSFTIAGTDRSIDIMELAKKLHDGKVPDGVPDSSTSTTPASRCRRPSRTAAMSPRSRSIPRPAWCRSCATPRVNDFGTVSTR